MLFTIACFLTYWKKKKSLFHTLLIGYLIGMVVVVPEGVLQISANVEIYCQLCAVIDLSFWKVKPFSWHHVNVPIFPELG